MSRYRCPRCKSDQIQVTVRGWANLDQSDPDNIQTEPADSDHEWENDSDMRCVSCGHVAVVREFQGIVRSHADAFLDDLVQVYRRHDMSLSHEDEHGAFIIERYRLANENWLRGAMLREP
jgi:hypothetical protein